MGCKLVKKDGLFDEVIATPKPCKYCGAMPEVLELYLSGVIHGADNKFYFVACQNNECKYRPYSGCDTTKSGAIQRWSNDEIVIPGSCFPISEPGDDVYNFTVELEEE